jgi:thioesterase domain-containing protein
MTHQELQDLFYREIPISQDMAVTVISASSTEVQLSIGLKENRNHKGTAFGGSQYAACALSCYGLFLVGVRERGITTNNIVIADGVIKYKAPVTTDFKVIAKWEKSEKDSFFKKLDSHKKAKVELKAQIFSGSNLCSEFSGFFVAIL